MTDNPFTKARRTRRTRKTFPEINGALRALTLAVHTHGQFVAVMSAFALSILAVPVFTPTTGFDDWVYVRAVEVLVHEGRLQIPNLAPMNLVTQLVWGGLWGSLFGTSPGSLRASVVLLWFAGGFACYGLLWEVTRDRARSALGTAIYVFNPVGYVLAFSFMTDAPFLTLFVTSVYCYVRAFRDAPSGRWLFAGSLAATAAGLLRQPGLLIPVGVLTGLAFDRRIRLDRRGIRLTVQIAALPLVAGLAFSAWRMLGPGAPQMLVIMESEVTAMGPIGLVGHVIFTFFSASMYLAMFVAPLAFMCVSSHSTRPSLHGTRDWVRPAAWLMFVAILAVAIVVAGGPLLPYGDWLNETGLTPSWDHLGGRPAMIGTGVRVALTACVVLTLYFVASGLIQALRRPGRLAAASGAGAAIVIGSLGIQLLAVIPTTLHFHLLASDRYFLPLLPLELAVVLWGLGATRWSLTAGWLLVAVFGIFAVAGTRDGLVFSGEAWELGREANVLGIPNSHLGAGAGWDGYYMGDLAARTRETRDPNLPWWRNLFNIDIDPQYVVVSGTLPGYSTVVRERSVDLWLNPGPVKLLLLRRDDVAGPP